MADLQIDQIKQSQYDKDGTQWSIKSGNDWYNGYLTRDAASLQPGYYDVEFKTSAAGKHYIVAIDGHYRLPPKGARGNSPAPRPQAAPGAGPSSAPASSAALHQRDMWIFAAGLANHIIGAAGSEWGGQALIELARNCATAARAAARVFDGAPLDAAKAAAERPAVPRSAPGPQADPDSPREAGPDFDDDIPF